MRRVLFVWVIGFALSSNVTAYAAEFTTNQERAPLRLAHPVRSIALREPTADKRTGGDSRPYDRHLWRAEARFGVAADLLRAIIRVESNFNPRATSKVGAKGLMQLMPLTAKLLGVRDVFDPGQNIQGGARYLYELARSFNGDLGLTLAAYHAGPTNVVNRGSALSSPVTRAYVTRVLAEYARLTAQALSAARGHTPSRTATEATLTFSAEPTRCLRESLTCPTTGN